MPEYRCWRGDCRTWYDKALGECPSCGTEPHRFNKWLRTAGLNYNLHNPPPDYSHAAAKKEAKEYLASL